MEMKDAYKLITKKKLLNSIQIVSLLAITTIALFIVSAKEIDVYYFNWIALALTAVFGLQLIVDLTERALFMKSEVIQNSLYDLQNNVVMDNVEGVLTTNCYYSMKKPLKPIPLENIVWMHKKMVNGKYVGPLYVQMVCYMNDNTSIEMTYKGAGEVGKTPHDHAAVKIVETVQAKNPNLIFGYEKEAQKAYKALKKNNYDYAKTFDNNNY